MIRMRWQDWLASVEDGWNFLKGIADQIFVVGLSMGGILSLTFAAKFPVKGVIAMSTPYEIHGDWRSHFLRQISVFKPYMEKNGPEKPSSEEVHPGWYDLEAVKEHISYPKNPVRSLAELLDLLAEMRTVLPEITAPVLLIHSRDDTYVSPDNMPAIYNALKTKEKEMFWVEHSGHVITREPQRERVFRAAADFIRRSSGQS
jgi:carboxylesterase